MMCRTAHAHLVQITRSSKAHMRIAVSGAVVATVALLRAMAVVTAPDKDGLNESVEVMGQQINKIMKGETDLGLDDVVFARNPPDPE